MPDGEIRAARTAPPEATGAWPVPKISLDGSVVGGACSHAWKRANAGSGEGDADAGGVAGGESAASGEGEGDAATANTMLGS